MVGGGVAGSQGRPGGPSERLPEALLTALAAAGTPPVTDPAVLVGLGTDWTGRWSGPVLAAVAPSSTEQVAAVLAAARAAGVPVQVQGGNTGLVGGSVPDRPALLLRTTGLQRLDPVDPLERTVLGGAGVTAARLAAHAAGAGLRFGVDLAARDSATIGGMVATNAGGVAVLAHGPMRQQVRGLTAVLADGRVVRSVGRPRKDNAGYALDELLVGSEGTLGVIIEVELDLHPAAPASTVALLGVTDLAGAVGAGRAVEAAGGHLLAAEVVDAVGARRAASALRLPDPLPPQAAWLLLLEVADGGTGEALGPVADQVVAVAASGPDRSRLWALRERQTELYAQLPDLVDKLDISVRLDHLDAAVAAIRDAARGAGPAGAGPQPSAGGAPWVGIFGHALDGNLHVQLVGADPLAVQRVLEVVAALGGSISAEHGIGRLKVAQLGLVRSADEVAWMRELKAGVDPAGLLNPGVLLGG